MSRNPAVAALRNLVGSAAGGGYSLPAAVTDAWDVHERVAALTIPEPPDLTHDTAAQQLVAAVAAGKPADPLAAAREVQTAAAERASAREAHTVLAAAAEQAAGAAAAVVADLNETIIHEHLAPAMTELYDETRTVAAALRGHNLADVPALVKAPAKVRESYLRLPALAARRTTLYQARSWANAVGGRQPEHDLAGLFLELQNPLALHPDHKPTSRAPGRVGPADPTERLLWIVGPEAAPARPWFPTVEAMDAAWWKQFGEGIETRANRARDAVAYGAVFGG